jgi:hypothetical protein
LPKYSTGPDLADLSMMLRAVEELHAVNISLSISVPPEGRTGLLVVKATAQLRAALDTARAPSVSRSLTIGSRDPLVGAAAMFRLMHEIDRDCSTFWQQSEMPSQG